MLPPRIPKKAKRASRWRSQAHLNFVRSHACCSCGDKSGIEAAHVRTGSGAGMGQKPDDWRTVSLCRVCHQLQHQWGEQTFWDVHASAKHQTVDELIEAFCKASPKAADIRLARQERESV